MDEKERLLKVIESEGLTSAQFADRIGINRATISHILNGRNAPSLDVLKRTLKVFITISPDWLILGVGSMYRDTLNPQGVLFNIPIDDNKLVQPEKLEKTNNKDVESIKSEAIAIPKSKKIAKILVFYDDNTFDEILNQ